MMFGLEIQGIFQLKILFIYFNNNKKRGNYYSNKHVSLTENDP